MKYLEILKEYDRQIVSESKTLDGIYKKLLGEECTCGQPDCPECGKKDKEDGIKKENLESNCCEGEKKDDTRVGFDESCVDKGNETKKAKPQNGPMVDKDTFLKGLSNDSGESNEDGGASADDDVVNDDGENGGSEEIKRKLQEFFGDSDKETTAESAEETVRKNQEEMSAKGVDGEQGENSGDSGDNGDSESSEEKTDGGSDSGSADDTKSAKKTDSQENSSDDTKSAKKTDSQENTENVTNECGNGKTTKELVGENEKGDGDDGEKQQDETPSPDETEEPKDEEELEEEMRLNESIQAIKKFVKANKKYFK